MLDRHAWQLLNFSKKNPLFRNYYQKPDIKNKVLERCLVFNILLFFLIINSETDIYSKYEKNSPFLICLACLMLFSCGQNNFKKNKVISTNLKGKNNHDIIRKKEQIILNKSFKYDVVLVSELSSNGLLKNKGYEIWVDSASINYLKSISTKEIINLLKSEESDFATYVLLYKLYGNTIPASIAIDISDTNHIKNWRNGINKERMIENWKKELIKQNHDGDHVSD